MKKRVLSLLLAFLMVASLVPANVLAVDGSGDGDPAPTETPVVTATVVPTDDPTPVADVTITPTTAPTPEVKQCAGKADVNCEAETHIEGCALYEAPEVTPTPAPEGKQHVEGCILDANHEGDCVTEAAQPTPTPTPEVTPTPTPEVTPTPTPEATPAPEQHPMVGKIVELNTEFPFVITDAKKSVTDGSYGNKKAYPERMEIEDVVTVNGVDYYQLKAAPNYVWEDYEVDLSGTKVNYAHTWLVSSSVKLVVEPENTCACCDTCTGAEDCECVCGNCSFCTKPDAPVPGSTVSVSGTLPADVSVSVTDADVSAQLAAFYVPASQLVFGLDISLVQNGVTYQPDGSVTVKVPVNAEPGTKIGILHTHGEETSYLGIVEVKSDRTVEFETNRFSVFAGYMIIIESADVDISKVMGGDSTAMLSTMLYDIKIGESPVDVSMIRSVDYTPGATGESVLEVTEVTTADGRQDWQLKTSGTKPADGDCGTLKITTAVGELTLTIRAKAADAITFIYDQGFFSVDDGKTFGEELKSGACQIDGKEQNYYLPVSSNDSYYYEVGWLETEKGGYQFAGWRDAKGNIVYGVDGTCTTNGGYWTKNDSDYWKWSHNGDLTLYPSWIRKTYTIKIVVDGEVKHAGTYTVEDEINLSEYVYNVEEYNGAKLVPWWKADVADGEDNNWDREGSGNPPCHKGNGFYTAEVIPAGQWGNVTLTRSNYIIFDFNDESGGWKTGFPHIGYGNFCEVIWAEPSERTGYEFAGWYDQAGKQVYYGDTEVDSSHISGYFNPESIYWDANGCWEYDGNAVLHAKWQPITYTIQYYVNDTTAESSHTYDEAKALSTFTKEGYTLTGWATTPDGEVEYDNGATVTNLTSTKNAVIDLYAVWEANPYTITYDVGEGTLSGTSLTYDIEDTVDLAKPTRDKYEFVGWKVTTADGNWTLNEQFDAEHLTVQGKYGDVTLEAQWKLKVANLEINLSGAVSGQNYVLSVNNSANALVTKVVLTDCKTSITIRDLPVDTYTVTADGNWSWRCKAGSDTANMADNDFEVTVSCGVNNEQLKTKWLNGYSYKKTKEAAN